MTIQAGQIITIGTAKFIIDDIRDGHRVGDIALRYTLRDGFIKLNGATVLRADYPRLVQWVYDNNLWTDDATALGLFGVGDGLTTMRLPDFRSRFLEGTDNNGGGIVGAGVPNITGHWAALHDGAADIWNGAVHTSGGANNFTGTIAGSFGSVSYILDASKSSDVYGASDTVQPAAVRLIAQIKY